MKKLIFILFFLFGFSNVYAIDERVTDFYFGNGVWNTEDDAEDSRDALEKFIKNETAAKDFYDRFRIPENYHVELVYNWHHSYAIDLLETFYQLKEEGQFPYNSDKGFFETMIDIATDPFFERMFDITVSLLSELTSYVESQNIAEMVEKYNASINNGRQVLLISHSQGNLFGLRAFNKLKDWQKIYFEQISVATPASRVASGFELLWKNETIAFNRHYVTLNDDSVISALLAFAAHNVLPSNAKNTIKSADNSNHEFVKSYLMGDISSEMIANYISNSLSLSIFDIPTQWEFTECVVCSTDNCKGKVTHKYDHELDYLMADNEVYPFNYDIHYSSTTPEHYYYNDYIYNKLYNIHGDYLISKPVANHISISHGYAYYALKTNDGISGLIMEKVLVGSTLCPPNL